jgi:hypothetical protein
MRRGCLSVDLSPLIRRESGTHVVVESRRLSPTDRTALVGFTAAPVACAGRVPSAHESSQCNDRDAYDLDSALMTLESWRVLKGSTQLMVKDIVFARA